MGTIGRRRKTQEETEFNARIGTMIWELRKLKEMQAKELAAAVGVSPQVISDYEAGEVSISLFTLDRICAQLQVSVADLVQTSTFTGLSRKRCARCLNSR